MKTFLDGNELQALEQLKKGFEEIYEEMSSPVGEYSHPNCEPTPQNFIEALNELEENVRAIKRLISERLVEGGTTFEDPVVSA